jgi:hypothetical protein
MDRSSEQKIIENLPQSAQEFIKLVIKKMGYRRSARRDVQAELTTHFEDELRDCSDQQQRQQKAQRLIEQFGDVKLLGILLRRAKKRCRPLWQTAVARTFQAIGILFLCLILYSAWFLTGKPNIKVDYLAIINKENEPVLSGKDNAWPIYEKAITLFVEPSKELEEIEAFKNWHSSYTSFAELNPEDRKKIRAWIEDNNSAWQQYVQAGTKPYSYRQIHYNEKDEGKWLLNILLPELGTLRNLARVGIWRSRMEIYDGQTDSAVDECLAVIRTGRLWQSNRATIVEQLVGLALSNLGHSEILYIISSRDVDSDKLQNIRQQILDIYKNGFPEMNFEGEKMMFMDIIQHTFTDSGLGGGHLIPERMALLQKITMPDTGNTVSGSYDDAEYISSTLLFTVPAMYHARRYKTVEKADEMYNQMGRIARMTPYQRHINDVKSVKLTEPLSKYRYFLVSMFVPTFNKAFELVYRTRTFHEATVITLTLQRYKLKHGQYPESLSQLHERGYLHSIPLDPFSDKPLVYKKTDEGFMLYSVGLDFEDDGGVLGTNREGQKTIWADEGDAVFWPVQK